MIALLTTYLLIAIVSNPLERQARKKEQKKQLIAKRPKIKAVSYTAKKR